MSDTKIHFELLAEGDRIKGIVNLLLRRKRLTPHVLILCPDEAMMKQLDQTLWELSPESFLPHAIATTQQADNARQPILLASTVLFDNSPEVMINAGLEIPPELTGFSHIVDFVDDWDAFLKQASRDRFRTYRQLGFEPVYLGNKA